MEQITQPDGVIISAPTGAVFGGPVDFERKITKLAFKQRMTQAERIAIRTAAANNPAVYDFQDLVDSATYIELDRPDAVAGVTAMEAAGLIAEGRADEILNAPIQDHERFKG